MLILAGLVIALSVTAGARSANPVTCHQPVLCPCGNTGKQVKVCAQGENPCIRWSKCKTCRDYLGGCLECPEGLEGLSCSKETEKLSRQRRQYATRPYRGHRRPVNNNPYQSQRQRAGCPELNGPKLGSINCVYNDHERTCVGKCLPGYTFEGRASETEITLTCTDDHFTPMSEFPPCKTEGKCDLVVQGSGSFNCTTGMSGTRCDVFCNRQFVGQYFCYPDQPWEPTLPDCVRPKNAQNVRQNCQCRNGGRCDSSGNCQCSNGWTGRFCERRAPRKSTCPDPGLIENGLRKNPDETESNVRQSFEEGSSVVYSCPSDEFALQGSPLLTCRNNGKWSSPVPKCIRIKQNPQTGTSLCQDPGVDSNGGRNAPSSPRGFPNGANLEYFCNDGYSLEGERSINCLSDGRWSHERPTCKQGRETTSPLRGTTCQDPGVDSNGSRNPPHNPNGFVQGANLEYSCNEGYDMDGESSIFCLATGTWSHSRPTCRYQGRGTTVSYCGDPGADSNGVRDVPSPPSRSGFPEGSRLEYSCNQGYNMQGNKMLLCLASGKWSSQRPMCIAKPQVAASVVYCPNPGSTQNGRIVYYAPLNKRQGGRPQADLEDPEFPERGSLVYSCDFGYTLMGGDTITCQNSGRWSADPPICVLDEPEVAYCPEPAPIGNGRVVYFPQLDVPRGNPDEEEYVEGGRLRYTCNIGYRLEGSDTLTCQATGRWSHQPPVCNQETGALIDSSCDNPGPITNGKVEEVPNLDERRSRPPADSVEYVEYPLGSTLVYSCNNGYRLHGASEITCQEGGQWSASPPTCITSVVTAIKYCPNPGPILNGIIRVTPPMARPRAGSGSLVAEDTPEYPEGTILTYECEDEYMFEGTETLTCQSTGTWSAAAPQCVSDCGKTTAGTTNRILHGNKTFMGEWPWMVGIAIQEHGIPVIICGGALLNTRTVLTAAHCLEQGETYTLFFGKHFRSTKRDDEKVQVARSSNLIIHPDYNSETFDSDIALIKFKPKIRYSTRVQPICLPTGQTTRWNLVVGKRGYVTGWGRNEKQTDSGELMMAHLPYQPKDDCLESFRINAGFTPEFTQNMFCAGFPDATQSTCRGDSGSPLVFYDSETQRHTVEGLVSFTIEMDCGQPGIYSVYTKVFRFLPWIYRNM